MKAIGSRVAALPGRPLDPDDYTTPADLVASDEAARSTDLEMRALEALARAMAQAGRAIASADLGLLRGAGSQLRDAPTKIAKARHAGAPFFAAVGDTLPGELEALAADVGLLTFAVGADADLRRRVAQQRNPEQMSALVSEAAKRQANSEASLLAARLRAGGLDDIMCMNLPDPAPLIGRLTGAGPSRSYRGRIGGCARSPLGRGLRMIGLP